MSQLVRDIKIWHESIENALLSKRFPSEKLALKEAFRVYKYLTSRARQLLCRHLSAYSDLNQLEWNVSGFKLYPKMTYLVIPEGDKYRIIREFEVEDFEFKELGGYMPFGNPQDIKSWSVVFKVEDQFGNEIDKEVMSSAPTFSIDDDMVKTEFETLLSCFELELRKDLDKCMDKIEDQFKKGFSSYNTFEQRTNVKISSVNDDLMSYKKESQVNISDISNKQTKLLGSMNFSYLVLMVFLLGIIGTQFYFFIILKESALL